MTGRPDRRRLLAGLGAAAAWPAWAAPKTRNERPDELPEVVASTVRQRVAPDRVLTLYLALPAKARGRQPAVLVVPDAYRLDEQARDRAHAVALAGYLACAADLAPALDPLPDPARVAADALATVRWLGRNPPGEQVLTGRVAALGWAAGGGVVNRVAVAAGDALAAGIAYDAPSPPVAGAAAVRAAMLLHYASRTAPPTPDGLRWANALYAAGVTVETELYDGAADEAAAALAWERTLAFLQLHLRPPTRRG